MKKTTKMAAVLAVALSAGFALSAYAQQKTMSIGTGGTGGVYYPLGGAVANVLSKNLPNVQATAEVTGGSVDNLKLIGTGKNELGFTMADAALNAYNGEDKFKSGKIPLQTLLVVYPNRMHVVTIEGTGIEKMSDMKGKRISTGSPGSATEVMAFRVIEAAGLDKDKDMKRERLGVAESVNAIKDGKIDAFFWVGGIPTAAVTDLAATPGVKMKLVDHSETVDKMNEKYGKLYSTSTIKAGSYPGYDKDNKIAEVWNLIVTNDKMSNDDAYAIVKTLVEKKADIVAVHKEALSFAGQSGPGALAGAVPSGRTEILQGKGHRRLIPRPIRLSRNPGQCAGVFVGLCRDLRRVAVDGEIVEPRLVVPRDRGRDHPRRKIAIGNAVSAITICGVNARMAGHAPDQRKTVCCRPECTGPHKLSHRINVRPQPVEPVQQCIRLGGHQAVAFFRLRNPVIILAAYDDAPIARRARITVIFRRFPDQRAVAP